MEFQPACHTTLWRSVGKTSQKLQECNVGSVGEPINYGRCSFNNDVSC